MSGGFKRVDKDTYFMLKLDTVRLRSEDPDTQVACVLATEDGTTVSEGYNGFVRGFVPTPEQLTRPEKYVFIEHAERNAIYNMVRTHTSVTPHTAYVDWLPCADCARGLAQIGIRRIVVNSEKQAQVEKNGRWVKDHEAAMIILDSVNTEIVYWNPQTRELEKYDG